MEPAPEFIQPRISVLKVAREPSGLSVIIYVGLSAIATVSGRTPDG
jgi:hypothetical protein